MMSRICLRPPRAGGEDAGAPLTRKTKADDLRGKMNFLRDHFPMEEVADTTGALALPWR